MRRDIVNEKCDARAPARGTPLPYNGDAWEPIRLWEGRSPCGRPCFPFQHENKRLYISLGAFLWIRHRGLIISL